MNHQLPRVVAFFVGLLSLSQEILWTRLVAFAYQTKPQAFALVLCFYLVGIALGAAVGRIACNRGYPLLFFSGAILLVSALADVATPLLYTLVHGTGLGLLVLCSSIVLTAALKSVLFPIVHHLGSNDVTSKKGVSFSRVYLANVLGSALGPLLTGLVLLDYCSLQDSFVIVGACTAALGCFVLMAEKRRYWSSMGAAQAASIPLLLLMPNVLIPALATEGAEAGGALLVLENRSGIIHTRADGAGDIVYGNNVYDGRISTDLRRNSNGIHRAYALAAMHAQPRSVLVIGLSGGAWTKVIASFPTVERIDVVEINPGYLSLISRYEEVSDILSDSRISYNINDGRRWLHLHKNEKYDLIVMNSIHHWRANATNLLSIEFMRLARDHLNERGIFYFNSTSSPEAFNTASKVFRHAFRYENFVAASDTDFRKGFVENRYRYEQIKGERSPLFDLSNPHDRLAIQSIYDVPFTDVAEAQRAAKREVEIVTDDNMIVEYRYGIGFF